ncbi:OLC1v1007633C1 [Oldenlandia corymbosa var. corymbosa]|uniref:RHOMBOID-like protein n=1 Tax=Oldenlandia corymbosa var. corymbosa TaxID=529605 RepID=A0AAV1DJX8_OLDCO|nr:OLC1v1007633C1 [Oldenlandia corymbosa var. corymbosa]
MGRKNKSSSENSPESDIEIKVQPRGTDPHPVGGPFNTPQQRPPSQFYSPPPRSSPPPSSGRLFKNWVPWSVPIIVAVNIGLFVWAMHENDCPQNSDNCIGASFLGRYAFQSTKENPLLGPSAVTLLKMGALEAKRVVEEHQVWRLASCMWLHAGVFHVLANMLSLLFVGIRLEQEFGFVRIGVVYVVSGIGGSLLSSLFVRNTISVGASGALFGLLGAMLSELLINWTIYENKLAALSTLLFIIMINLAVGILPHVDNFAHLGGFVTGFLLGFVALIRPQFKYVNQKNAPPGFFVGPPKSKYKAYQYAFLFISLIVLAAGFTVGLIVLMRGVDGNDHCSWCHYLSCIPTPLWTCEARCTSSRIENQVNLTCLANHKSGFYILRNGNSTPEIQRLCTALCS